MGRTGFFRVNPVRPGSNRVGRVIPGQHGSTRVERVILGPLGHPEPVGSSHANPVFFRFSVNLTRPIRVNPTNPGQPGKTRFDPFFSRLLRPR